MKKGYSGTVTHIVSMVAVIAITASPVSAQFSDAGEILKSGKTDANTLMREYLNPVGKGFGIGLNTGWFSTAKVHKKFGFDITVNASLALVPDSDELYDLSTLELQEVELVSNGPESPTAAGPDETGAVIGSKETFTNPQTNQQERLFEFELPPGSGVSMVPAPMVQASIGLIKSTDLTVRYLPTVSLPNDADVDLFGLGVKHEINQWLPGGSKLPLDLAIQAGFTNLSASVPFEVLPDVDSQTKNEFSSSTWEGQKSKFSSSGFTLNALVGKTLPIISIFAGVGYETSTVDISTPGSYPVIVPNEQYDPTDPNSKPKKVDNVDDPIDVSIESSGLHALAGFRLKLLIFNISGSYTLAEYPTAQVGVGIGIR